MWKIFSLSHILSAAGDALSTYYPSDSSILIISYMLNQLLPMETLISVPIWCSYNHIYMPFSPFTLSTTISSMTNWVYLGEAEVQYGFASWPPHPNQCLSHPTYYPPILIFPIPMHKCKELSSFSLCVFPLLLRHDLMWDLITHVRSSVGRFSLFCENRPVPILSWCYENPVGSLIYIYLGLVRNGQVINFQIFSNSPGSQISQFSCIWQQPVLK
jgi:hypothetical protein